MNFDKVEQVFDAVNGCASVDREAELDRWCAGDAVLRAEVASLLAAADVAPEFLATGSAIDSRDAVFDPLQPGDVVGAYRCVREIGRGGMGVVYLAVRADGAYQQQVAIKVASTAAGAQRDLLRLKSERQLLASLCHPGIARLLDGGTTDDGRPYLVLEYVVGDAIDRYCSSKQASLRERLALFASVCSAVECAHRLGIVHRDIKPANILVSDDGVPKLLDFGVAKLLARDGTPLSRLAVTRHGCAPLTPEYASPEQIDGAAIGPASDVYSLGVLLYELLSGQRPPAPGAHTALPSQVLTRAQARNARDLERIVRSALHPDAPARYQSAGELAADINSYLESRPVSVLPATRRYRFARFAARHRFAVSLVGFALIVTLSGAGAATYQWRSAHAERDRAAEHSDELRTLARSMVFDIANELKATPGATRVRKQLIDKGVEYLDRAAAAGDDDPQAMRELASAYAQLGSVQGHPGRENLGDVVGARRSLQRSLAIRERLATHAPTDVRAALQAADSLRALSSLEGAAGKVDKARDLAERCIDVLGRHVGPGRPKVKGRLADCYAAASTWDTALGQPRRADARVADARAQIPRLFDRDASEMPPRARLNRARVHESQAKIAAQRGDLRGALAHERERLDIILSLRRSKRRIPLVAAAYQAYGARLLAVDEPQGALSAFEEAMRRWQLLTARNPVDARPRQMLAGIEVELARVHGALAQSAFERGDDEQHARSMATACDHHERSRGLLASLPGSTRAFSPRFPWLGSPADALRSYHSDCVDAQVTEDKSAAALGGSIDDHEAAARLAIARTLPSPSTALAAPLEATPLAPTPILAPVAADSPAAPACGPPLAVFPGAQLPFVTPASPASPLLAMGDVDADGALDVLVGTPERGDLWMLLALPDGTFTRASRLRPERFPSAARLVDLDGDTHVDLVATIAGRGIRAWHGEGDGRFGAGRRIGISGLRGLQLADFDGDTLLDIALIRDREFTLTVLLNDGARGLVRSPPRDIGHEPSTLTSGDVNGDGHIDVLTLDAAGTQVAVLLGNGDGRFAPPGIIRVRVADPCSLVLADFSGDGIADIVVRHRHGGEIQVYRGFGDGTFEEGAAEEADGTLV